MPIILIIAIILIAGSAWVLLSGRKETGPSETNAQPDGVCPPPNPVRVPGIPIAKLLGWIYIFAFVFILGCYIYGLFGVFNKKSDLQPRKYTQRRDVESLKYDELRLTGIVWIRCAIEKYIAQKGKLPQSLYEEELRVGTNDSPAGWLADRSGITYRIIEPPSEKNELICPESNSDCEKLIADNNFFLYELCTNFKQDFGDEERALVRNPSESSFPSSDYCGGDTYHVNPKHSKGEYCYIFYSPKEQKNYPSFIKKLNSYDDFYDKYFNH